MTTLPSNREFTLQFLSVEKLHSTLLSTIFFLQLAFIKKDMKYYGIYIAID